MDFEALYPGTCTSVSLAARKGKFKILNGLLESGKASNIEDNRGWRALHHAAAGGHVKCVQLLLKASDVDVNAITHMRETALHLVCASSMKTTRCFIIAKLLLENGADPNIEKHNRYKTLLNSAIVNKNDLKLVELLLSYKADVNEVDDAYGSVLDAAMRRSSIGIVRLLLKQKLDLNPFNTKHDFNFFHYLVSKRNMSILDLCLRNPQCCRVLDAQLRKGGNTALMIACSFPLWLEGIEKLLDFGANANIRNEFNNIAVNIFAESCVNFGSNSEEEVCRIFFRLFHATYPKELRPDPNLKLSIFHSLLHCGGSYSKNILLKLINEENYIKPNQFIINSEVRPSNENWRCFHYYEKWLHRRTVSTVSHFFQLVHWDFDILNSLLKDVVDLNDISRGQIPPLVTASACCLWNPGRKKFVHLLLDRGADACVKLFENDPLPTAFMFAVTHSFQGILEFLLVHSTPAEVVFIPTSFLELRTMYQNIMKMDSYRKHQCMHRPVCYGYLTNCLLSILRWLKCVDKFLRNLPGTALELVEIFCKFVDPKYLIEEVPDTEGPDTEGPDTERADTENFEPEGDGFIEFFPHVNHTQFRDGRNYKNNSIMSLSGNYGCYGHGENDGGNALALPLRIRRNIGTSYNQSDDDNMEVDSENRQREICNKTLFISTYKKVIHDVKNLVGTIKPLRLLCILEIRLLLWKGGEGGRKAPICDSIRTFVRDSSLPHSIERLILLGAENDSCC